MSGPQRAPAVAWSQTATTGWTEPVIAGDGTVYAIDGARLVAFTPAGAMKWATSLDAFYSGFTPGPPTTLAIGDDGIVYALDGGIVFAIAPDGTVSSGSGNFCVAKGFEVIPGDYVYLFVESCVYLSGHAGVVLVHSGGPGFAWSSQRVLSPSPPSWGPDGSLYFIGTQSDMTTSLLAFVPQWTVRWTVPATPVFDAFDNTVAWPVVRDDGSVVYADSSGLHAVTASGTPQWTVPSAFENGALAARSDGTVYAGSASGGLVMVGPDGTPGWQWGGSNLPASRPIVDGDGTVYVATSGGIAAIASDGMELWESSAAATPLAIDGTGALYALDASGKVLSVLR